MPELKGTKTIHLNWPEWKEYCAEHGIDPRENCEDGHDLGGGNSLNIICHEDPPDEERMSELRSKCHGAKVIPHPQEFVCSKCGLSCLPIEVEEKEED